MPHTELDPQFQDITPAWKGLPNMNGWYFTSVVDGISEEALPWLLAQGWQLNAANTDDTTEPPTTTYLMARTRLLHWNVLYSLLVDFTNSFNEGRWANDARYEDIIFNMQNMLDKHQSEVSEFTDEKAGGESGYLTIMLNQVDQTAADYDSYKAEYQSKDSGDRATELAKLKTTWANAADTAQSEYDEMTSGLNIGTIIAGVDAAIADFAVAVTAFNNEYADLGTTLVTDYEAHQVIAKALLTDLGSTELIRINEKFDADLATQSQAMIDRGFYSSGIMADITARNTRDRNDAIAELNDKLSREKLQNQHTLYGQQYQMRLGGLDASMKAIDASSKIVSSRLQHGQFSAEIRHKIATLSVQTRLAVLGLREKYYESLLQSISWESARETEMYQQLVQVRIRQFEILGRTMQQDMELLKYKLDGRNEIAASIFGFVERRTDAYPDQNSMAQLATNLGETGAATWQSA